MARLPQSAWATLWIAQGGNPRKADLYSAVIMGESGGDAGSTSNPCCKGGAQINLQAHPDVSLQQALNPVFATRWTIKNSNNGRDFGIWEAYTNGSYAQYLGGSGFGKGKSPPTKRKAKTMLADLELPGFSVPLPGPDINPLQPFTGAPEAAAGLVGIDNPLEALQAFIAIPAFFKGLGELILTPEGWLRVAKLGGGSMLMFWGLRIIVRESTGTDPVKAATSTVKKGAELAALAATVK